MALPSVGRTANSILSRWSFGEEIRFWIPTYIPILEECVNKSKGMKRVLQERGLWRPDLLKQCGRAKKDRKSRNLGYGDRLFEGKLGDYETRTADRCEIGKDCCHLRILEAQPYFLEEKSMLETVINRRPRSHILS